MSDNAYALTGHRHSPVTMMRAADFEPDKWPNTSNLKPIPEIVENGKNGYLVESSNTSDRLAQSANGYPTTKKQPLLGAGTRHSGGSHIRSQTEYVGPSTCLDPSMMHRSAVAGITMAVLVGYCCTSIYAALNCRGLYADASYYLLKIAGTERFLFNDPARGTVQVLRQTAVVILRRLTNLGLFELGQAFSLSMLLLPIVLCALCWPILPQERKSWVIFPVLGLLAGVSASNFAAIGEGAVAASYLWPLLFLFLFRVEHLVFQIAFLLLCIPALFLHEAALPFMLVFLFACAGKYLLASTRAEEIFLGICATMFLCIIAYEIRWIIHPINVVDRDGYIVGLRQLAFVVAGDRWNLPLLTGVIGLMVLAIVAVLRLESTNRVARAGTLVATLIFIAWALFAAIIPWVSDATFSPFPQYMARNQALFVGGALAAVAVVAFQQKIPQQIWSRPTTFVVIVALACAQLSWDLAATDRWRVYMADVRSRLARSEGLISWEQALALGDADQNRSWQAMGFGWTLPGLSVVLQSGTPVRSLIAAPKETSWQPFDPSNVDHLPRIRGVDYTAYVDAMKAGQSL